MVGKGKNQLRPKAPAKIDPVVKMRLSRPEIRPQAWMVFALARTEKTPEVLGNKRKPRLTVAVWRGFNLVELRGVEPLSESALTGLSPGAVRFQAFPLCKDTGQTLQFSRVMMRGRGNSYPPHGRHLNDAFPGRWPFRFRRSLLKQRRQQCSCCQLNLICPFYGGQAPPPAYPASTPPSKPVQPRMGRRGGDAPRRCKC